MDEALAQQAGFLDLIKSYGSTEVTDDYEFESAIPVEEEEQEDESLGQDVGMQADMSDQIDDMYFDQLNQIDMSSYDFIDQLVSGNVDSYAMGESAKPMYETYATVDKRKANSLSTTSATGTVGASTFGNSIASRESDGKDPYHAVPRKKDGSLASSAAGKYQFLWNTHHKWIERVTGVHSKQEFLDSPEAQEQAFEHWDRTTLTPQMQKYKDQLPQYTEDEIKMMIHFGGEGNLQKAIRDKNFDRPLDSFGTTMNSYLKKKQYGGDLENEGPVPKVSNPLSTSQSISAKKPKYTIEESSIYDDYIAPVVKRVDSFFNKSNENYKDDLENVSPSVDGSFQEGKHILGGDFVEESKDSILKQKDWLSKPKDYTFGDSKIPLKNIKKFYGIENGEFKVGELKDFQSETDLVPVRSKDTSVYSAANEPVKGFFGENDSLTMRDSLGNKLSENVGRNGKLILYSPVTGKKIFLNGETNFKATEINKFIKDNPQSKYIMLDNGRFYKHVENEEGLTPEDFKSYNSTTFKGSEQKTYNIVSKKQYGGSSKYKFQP